MEYHCPMCVYVTRYHKDFCIHIVRVHKNDPRFIVYCQIGQCAFSTKVWNSYKQHISIIDMFVLMILLTMETMILMIKKEMKLSRKIT